MAREPKDTEWSILTRRDFMRAAGIGAAAIYLGCNTTDNKEAAPQPAQKPAAPVDDDPIATLPDGPAERRFFGDEVMRFHDVLWDKPKALASRGGLPTTVTERVKLCIVGGGLSGLSMAWLLKDYKPLVLEGGTRLGGNAKGQRWGDVAYSIGSAYITNTSLDDEHMQMLKKLGLHERWRFDDPTHDRMYIGGTIHDEFWFGGTDKKRAKDFVAAWDYFKKVRETAFPDIPFEKDGALTPEQWKELDNRTFADELKKSLGKQLHPHVEDVVRQYSWSSFGADHTEISAAAGLNFLASDLGGMYVFPGGNSAISSALAKDVRASLGHDAVRSSQMVVDVRRGDDGVRVTYLGEDNQLRTIAADACVVCTPKFVAKKLVDDLPQAQLDAIAQLTYRSYVVAHVLVDQPRPADFHDLFCIAGKAPEGSLRDELAKRPFTDIVLGTFATNGHPSRTVLNLYRGIPFDGARPELFAEGSYDRHRALLEPALPVALKSLGLDPAKVKDLRMSRWGHPLVVPKPGLISSGAPARAAATHKERIFFCQQDNNAMPAFESAFAAAAETRDAIKKLLG